MQRPTGENLFIHAKKLLDLLLDLGQKEALFIKIGSRILDLWHGENLRAQLLQNVKLQIIG